MFASTFQLEQSDRKIDTSAIYLIFFLTCVLKVFEHMCGISAPFTLCNRAATRTVSYFPHCVPYCENLLYRNQSESKSSSHRSLSARAARLLAGECARFLFCCFFCFSFLLYLFLLLFLLLLVCNFCCFLCVCCFFGYCSFGVFVAFVSFYCFLLFFCFCYHLTPENSGPGARLLCQPDREFLQTDLPEAPASGC